MTEIALIGKKMGMTREFLKTGQSIPVTVVKMEKGRVIQLINEDKRGYNAVQVGYGKIKNSKLNKDLQRYNAKFNARSTNTKEISGLTRFAANSIASSRSPFFAYQIKFARHASSDPKHSQFSP